MPKESFDRLDVSAVLIMAVFGFTILCIAAIVVHAAIRSRSGEEDSMRAVVALNLSNLALAPSGQPQRSPELSAIGVDIRFIPTLPHTSPEPVGLVLRAHEPHPSRLPRCRN